MLNLCFQYFCSFKISVKMCGRHTVVILYGYNQQQVRNIYDGIFERFGLLRGPRRSSNSAF